MLVPLLTLGLFAFAISMIVNLAMRDGRKILAALRGRSWAAQAPVSMRPVTVRFSGAVSPPQRVRARPEWRAAA